jgi:hypothetical protein
MKGKGIDTKSIQEIGWLKLENAAKLFPAIMSGELTSVFRITAFLKKPIKFSAVKEAVEITSRRFPYFSVSLGSGCSGSILNTIISFHEFKLKKRYPVRHLQP